MKALKEFFVKTTPVNLMLSIAHYRGVALDAHEPETTLLPDDWGTGVSDALTRLIGDVLWQARYRGVNTTIQDIFVLLMHCLPDTPFVLLHRADIQALPENVQHAQRKQIAETLNVPMDDARVQEKWESALYVSLLHNLDRPQLEELDQSELCRQLMNALAQVCVPRIVQPDPVNSILGPDGNVAGGPVVLSTEGSGA